MLWSDIREIKKIFEVDPGDTSEDFKFSLFNEWASGWMEEILNREFTYKTRTKVYKGTNTQKLLLRHRPVYPAPTDGNSILTVYEDTGANFGSATGAFDPTNTLLIYGVDYALDIDQDDGSSRSGILYRLNRYWPRPRLRQAGLLSPFVGPDTGSIKVISAAGYTADTLPSQLRAAAVLLVARMLYVWPLGMSVTSESYEERSISVNESQKEYILGPVRGMIWPFRNWKF